MKAPSTDALLGEMRILARRVLTGRAQAGDLERLATLAEELDTAALSGGAPLPVAWIRAAP